MSDQGSPTITDADVRSLAAKREGLHALLSPGEQTLLHAALRRAASTRLCISTRLRRKSGASGTHVAPEPRADVPVIPRERASAVGRSQNASMDALNPQF